MPAQNYVIPDAKLSLYLLNINHKRGASKAKFFLSRGFSLVEPGELASALFDHASSNWPGSVTPQAFGELFELVGALQCPDGSTPRVLAVWKVEAGTSTASLVTAYPYRPASPC